MYDSYIVVVVMYYIVLYCDILYCSVVYYIVLYLLYCDGVIIVVSGGLPLPLWPPKVHF